MSILLCLNMMLSFIVAYLRPIGVVFVDCLIECLVECFVKYFFEHGIEIFVKNAIAEVVFGAGLIFVEVLGFTAKYAFVLLSTSNSTTINGDNVFPADATFVAEAPLCSERVNGNESLRLKPIEPLRIKKRSALSSTMNIITIAVLKKIEPLRIEKRRSIRPLPIRRRSPSADSTRTLVDEEEEADDVPEDAFAHLALVLRDTQTQLGATQSRLFCVVSEHEHVLEQLARARAELEEARKETEETRRDWMEGIDMARTVTSCMERSLNRTRGRASCLQARLAEVDVEEPCVCKHPFGSICSIDDFGEHS